MPEIVQHARKSTVILKRPFVDTVTFTGLRLERQTKTFVRQTPRNVIFNDLSTCEWEKGCMRLRTGPGYVERSMRKRSLWIFFNLLIFY